MPSSESIGISNLPNQRHKIVSRKGANFTVMVVGESGLGKTTFINTLFTTTLREYKKPEQRHSEQLNRTVNIDLVRADIHEKGFNCRLTMVDTPGFGDFVNNKDCWVPVVDFIDDQYLSYHKKEQQSQRIGQDDLRVHVCLYFIQPTGHTLKPLDIQVMKQLGQRVNLIPVIAKADTLTPSDMELFKDRIRDCISTHGIQVYSAPVHSDEEDGARSSHDLMSALPFSIIGSDSITTPPGRQYAWGVAQVENEEHCDFVKLRNLLIRTHMHDLISSTQEIHYENYRSERMSVVEGKSDDDPATKANKALIGSMKKDEEMLRKRFTEQVRMEENRFRQWEQRLVAERDRLNKDLEAQLKIVKIAEDEIEELAKRFS